MAGNRPGRPPKFPGPSRVVTVTLPETTLTALESLDEDRGRAIVAAADLAVSAAGKRLDRSVEIVAVTPHTAVITVPHAPALEGLRGLKLIEIMPSRYLILLEPGMAPSEVEIALLDRIDALSDDQAEDGAILAQLLQHLRGFRRSDRTTTGELILVAI